MFNHTIGKSYQRSFAETILVAKIAFGLRSFFVIFVSFLEEFGILQTKRMMSFRSLPLHPRRCFKLVPKPVPNNPFLGHHFQTTLILAGHPPTNLRSFATELKNNWQAPFCRSRTSNFAKELPETWEVS